jgi:hypothetical protein
LYISSEKLKYLQNEKVAVSPTFTKYWRLLKSFDTANRRFNFLSDSVKSSIGQGTSIFHTKNALAPFADVYLSLRKIYAQRFLTGFEKLQGINAAHLPQT